VTSLRKEETTTITIKLLKQKRASLSDGLILSPNNKLIKVSKKILKQFQDGGFEIKNGVVSKKEKAKQSRKSYCKQKNQIR
jgi:hypothetical protein